jgi:hypothetical protein
MPLCDTPSEVTGLWWGVFLEKDQCSQGNTHSYGDSRIASNSDTSFEDTETEQREHVTSFHIPYELPVSTVLFIFGTAGNVILIIIITCNKDMRTIPNMYILNLAISDMIYLMVHLIVACANRLPDIWLGDIFVCKLLPFVCQMSVDLSAYFVALLSIHRYRVTLNPVHDRVYSQPTWRVTGATICGVWIVAALFAIPAALSKDLCWFYVLLWPTNDSKQFESFQILVSCVLPLCVIAFSYIMTYRHLLRGTCSLSEEQQIPRMKTHNDTETVLFALSSLLLFSYEILQIFNTEFNLEKYRVTFKNEDNFFDSVRVTNMILYLLHSINSCLNPVALCCTIHAFRRQFKRYLTCCCKAKSPPTDYELIRRN